MSRNTRREWSRPLVWIWRIAVICRKELLQFLRNPVILIFLIYSFTFSIYDSAVSIRRDLRNAATVVLDNDHSRESRELIHRFREPYFRRLPAPDSGEGATRMLDTGEAMLVLDVPPQFDRDLRQGRTARVQLQLDGSHANLAYLASSYAGRIVDRYSQELAVARAGASEPDLAGLPLVENRDRVWFNPNRDETLYRAIEEIAQHILLFSLLLPAAAMAREKERGTVEQLLVSPLHPLQIMLGKILPMTAIILTAAAVSLLGVVEGVLQLRLRGDLWLFFAVTALFSFSICSLGILIASVTRNIAQVGIVSIMLMPVMLLLSGSDTPPEMMPKPLLPVMYASPMHHYLNAAFGILLKGAGPATIGDSVLAMTLLGSGVFLFSLARFRRQFR